MSKYNIKLIIIEIKLMLILIKDMYRKFMNILWQKSLMFKLLKTDYICVYFSSFSSTHL